MHEFLDENVWKFFIHMIFLMLLPCIYGTIISATNSYLKKRQSRLPQVIPLRNRPLSEVSVTEHGDMI